MLDFATLRIDYVCNQDTFDLTAPELSWIFTVEIHRRLWRTKRKRQLSCYDHSSLSDSQESKWISQWCKCPKQSLFWGRKELSHKFYIKMLITRNSTSIVELHWQCTSFIDFQVIIFSGTKRHFICESTLWIFVGKSVSFTLPPIAYNWEGRQWRVRWKSLISFCPTQYELEGLKCSSNLHSYSISGWCCIRGKLCLQRSALPWISMLPVDLCSSFFYSFFCAVAGWGFYEFKKLASWIYTHTYMHTFDIRIDL